MSAPQSILELLREGQFFDVQTLSASLTVVAYNSAIDSFLYTKVDLEFASGGVLATGSTSAVPVLTDVHRRLTAIVMTAILTPVVVGALLLELRGIFRLCVASGRVARAISVQRRLWYLGTALHAVRHHHATPRHQ